MEDSAPQNPSHEETIVPVRPGLKGAKPVAPREERSMVTRTPILGISLGALLVVAAVVIFVLPDWVAEQQSQEPVTEVVEPAEVLVEPAGPVLTAEELEALREEAERLLALLLPQQARLDAQTVSDWGGEDFEQYQASSREGDDAYLDDLFQDAIPAYTRAHELGEALLTRSVDLIDAALAAGQEALEVGNSTVAAEQFQLVLAIEPENARAQAGLLRAERLPEVLALMGRGGESEQAGRLEEAAQAFRDALELDELWAPARSALTSVNARLQARRFDSLMSQGFGALADQEYGDAYDFFGAAIGIRRDSREALDGQAQAEQGQKLDQIALVEARALAFERRELWEQAIRLYRDLLETDATLTFAQEGLERTQLRGDLDLKLTNLIENPNLLFDDRILNDANELLADARAVAEVGPRLEEQTANLGRLVRLASTPVAVELHSDAMTEVTLFRVGALGNFNVKQVELRPGTYTLVGSRIGFRDVRETFTVLPGRKLAPILVQCVESIR